MKIPFMASSVYRGRERQWHGQAQVDDQRLRLLMQPTIAGDLPEEKSKKKKVVSWGYFHMPTILGKNPAWGIKIGMQ
jgi:hypothetical protein